VIRAFIAVTLETKVIDEIAAAGAQLREQIAGVRWAAPGNFHLTLKFLGNIDEATIDALDAALRDALRLFPAFTISAKGLGVFPGPRRPRVLWVGLIGASLVSLASRIGSALEPLGFAPEQRPFTPHLTIGRWRETDRSPSALVRLLKDWEGYDFGTSRVESVKLIQSVLKPGGPRYNELITLPLLVSGLTDKQ
jgi:2'-5' RNA ligase